MVLTEPADDVDSEFIAVLDQFGGFLWALAFRVKKDSAKLERGIVGYAKLPVRAQTRSAGIGQVSINDFEEIRDLLLTRRIWAKPPVLMPLLQAHRHCRQSIFCSLLSRCEYRHPPISVSQDRRWRTLHWG